VWNPRIWRINYSGAGLGHWKAKERRKQHQQVPLSPYLPYPILFLSLKNEMRGRHWIKNSTKFVYFNPTDSKLFEEPAIHF
jgi:hypothetical protein